MQGSPLLRLLVIAAAMALLYLPLQRLTGARSAAPPVAARIAPAKSVQLTITATSGPFAFTIKYLGQPIWHGEAKTETLTQTVPLPFPPEGLELGLEGEMKNPTPTGAVKLTVTPPDGLPLEKIVWVSGPVDEVLTFQE